MGKDVPHRHSESMGPSKMRPSCLQCVESVFTHVLITYYEMFPLSSTFLRAPN